MLWEGHEIGKQYSTCFDIHLVMSKQVGDLKKKIEVFSENMNFKSLPTWICFIKYALATGRSQVQIQPELSIFVKKCQSQVIIHLIE